LQQNLCHCVRPIQYLSLAQYSLQQFRTWCEKLEFSENTVAGEFVAVSLCQNYGSNYNIYSCRACDKLFFYLPEPCLMTKRAEFVTFCSFICQNPGSSDNNWRVCDILFFHLQEPCLMTKRTELVKFSSSVCQNPGSSDNNCRVCDILFFHLPEPRI
jgi:hypothetical protein